VVGAVVIVGIVAAATASATSTGGTFIASGLAVDGVTAVSFTVSGKAVEVPVKDNVWVY
jgi:hypothetical protein